ncbi:tetratricopeptide repeat protein [Sphingomonas sp.]|uniref:tetratricopeptide repeat protein n=1 Tax=Sphingomonas sp. TaxID=28214 RepID=UPI003CC6A034
MPDVSAYPMLARRVKRRRGWRLPSAGPRMVRLAAVLVLALALLAGIAWAARPARPGAAQLLADAQMTLRAGNYHAARRNAERAVIAAPRSAAAHQVLARALLELGEGLAAEAEVGRAAAAGAPAARLHVLIAQARLLQGDATGALAEADRAVPADAARVRAGALILQGQGQAAQQLLELTVAAAPRDAQAWTALGRLRLDADEMGGAADAAATAVRLAPGEPAALTLQGEVVRARFGLMAALPWFEAALNRDAYYVPALVEQAATLGDAGRYAEALAATRKALVARPGSAPAFYLQAVIAMRGGKPDLARRLLAAGGGALDAMPGALLLGGAANAATGRWEEAVTNWRRLVVAQPMNVAARRLLATALVRAHDPRGALDVLRPVALRGDADSYTLMLAARSWTAASDPRAAAGLLDRAAAEPRGGALLFASDEAPAVLTVAAAGAPGDPTYALGVIRALASADDRVRALAQARTLAAAMPRDPAAQLVWGDLLAAAGRDGEAAVAYTRAADLRFDEPTALRLVDALGRAGKPQDAAATLALYLSQNPQSLTARRLLGHWQVAAGAWSPAIEALEDVRARTGDRDAALLADLALAYAGDGDGSTARSYARAAYRLQPMSAGVADAYGVALAAAGEASAARQLFDKAVALAPDVPVYAAHRRQLG